MASEVQEIRRPVRQRFYFYALVCAAIVLLAGFSRTYFLKTIFGTPPLYSLLHLHGIVMTSWFLGVSSAWGKVANWVLNNGN
jgi:hypothetical protein